MSKKILQCERKCVNGEIHAQTETFIYSSTRQAPGGFMVYTKHWPADEPHKGRVWVELGEARTTAQAFTLCRQHARSVATG